MHIFKPLKPHLFSKDVLTPENLSSFKTFVLVWLLLIIFRNLLNSLTDEWMWAFHDFNAEMCFLYHTSYKVEQQIIHSKVVRARKPHELPSFWKLCTISIWVSILLSFKHWCYTIHSFSRLWKLLLVINILVKQQSLAILLDHVKYKTKHPAIEKWC